MQKGYVLVQSKADGHDAIRLTDEPYSGIIFSYGRVAFSPDEATDTLHINFDYEIHDNASKFFDKKIFEKYIGELLEQLIHEGIQENSLTYTGGLGGNENRTENSNESDL